MNMPSTSRLSIIAALMLSLLLASCGGGGSVGVESVTPSSGLEKILSWAPPDSYTDDTVLDPESELSEYDIYVNETGVFSESDEPVAVVAAVDSAGNAITSFNLMNVSLALTPDVTYYVSMRSVTSSGVTSDFSPAVSF
ncbi:MAG: hypothetical protein IH628_04165, partial [Proteobacteria bacterium]|nr:hypothetical protein [Pseudomonadota bacterium]